MKQNTVVLTLLLLTATTVHSGPPLITDDAGTVEVGKVEVELNSSYVHDRENINGIQVSHELFNGESKLTTGLYKDMGVSLAIPYTFSDRIRENGQLAAAADGFGDMTMELKYAFAEVAGINLAIKPAITFPTGKYSSGLSEGSWEFGGTLIASSEFDNGTYALHANLGYGHHNYRTADVRSCNRSDLWSGSLAGEARFAKGVTAVTELGLSTTQDSSTKELTGFVQVGARYELTEYLNLDTGIKFGLTKPEDGLSVCYGLVLKF